MNIAVYGGTFNPPHMGHLITIEYVREQGHFDKILFIPSAQPPNKFETCLASADDRLRMTTLAIEETKEFEVSDLEIRRPGISYTIDTLQTVESLYPAAKISLIIGSDNFIEFQTWKSPNEILARAQLVVMNRPGFPLPPARNDFSRFATFIKVPQINISSSDIRRKVKLRHSIRYLVPKPVEEFILRKNLYRD
jgi:nicotinate-nucleotide adenylyltransferase